MINQNSTSDTKLDALFLQYEVEQFLYKEAALLDEWRLDDWLALFTDDARYVVPATDLPDGDPQKDLVFIDDDRLRLQGRANRLKSRHAHREYPWSRTRRFITNIMIKAASEDELGVAPEQQMVDDIADAMRGFLKFHGASQIVIEESTPTEFGQKLMAML